MSLNAVPAGNKLPEEVNVIIEIQAHADPVKYEVDKESGAVFVDRFMSTPMFYPCNYGYIPNTLADDGDPIDVLVDTPHRINSGSVITCRPIGVLKMVDESGEDYKLIAVPTDDLTPIYRDVKCVEDLPPLLVQQIEHFFTHYKDLEKGKWVKIDGWGKADEAKKAVEDAVRAFNKDAGIDDLIEAVKSFKDNKDIKQVMSAIKALNKGGEMEEILGSISNYSNKENLEEVIEAIKQQGV